MAAILTYDGADGHIRWGKDLREWLDPYDFACSFRKEGTTIRLFCAAGSFGPGARRDITNELARHGFTRVIWERSKSKKLEARGGEIDEG